MKPTRQIRQCHLATQTNIPSKLAGKETSQNQQHNILSMPERQVITDVAL